MVFGPGTFEAKRLRILHGYLDCVSQVDYPVGELLAYLEERGLSENAIVVYGSDLGDYACEHGMVKEARLRPRDSGPARPVCERGGYSDFSFVLPARFPLSAFRKPPTDLLIWSRM
jgi:hypothetical protein